MGRCIPRFASGAFPLMLVGAALLALAAAQAAPLAAGPWVFSGFFDNGRKGMHPAYSRDGLKWTPLAGRRPVLAPTVGGELIQDACIVLEPDSVYQAVWTAGWYALDIGITYSRKRYEGVRSRDLKTWTAPVAALEMPSGARHGGVSAMPAKIQRGLFAAMSLAGPTVEKDGTE